MIGIILTGIIIVCTIGMYIAKQKIEQNRNKIIELENRLTQYYKEREQRLKSKGLIKRGPEWPE